MNIHIYVEEMCSSKLNEYSQLSQAVYTRNGNAYWDKLEVYAQGLVIEVSYYHARADMRLDKDNVLLQNDK